LLEDLVEVLAVVEAAVVGNAFYRPVMFAVVTGGDPMVNSLGDSWIMGTLSLHSDREYQ
jgi:hypothetical protein